MNAAKAAEPAATGAQASPIGQFDGPGVPHHHVLDISPAIHEDAHLPADVVADLAQLPGEFVADQPIGGKPPLEEAVELLDLAGLEAAGIAEYLDGGLRTERVA